MHRHLAIHPLLIRGFRQSIINDTPANDIADTAGQPSSSFHFSHSLDIRIIHVGSDGSKALEAQTQDVDILEPCFNCS